MDPTPRIYLDNAATTFPKPESVVRAVAEYLTHNGAAAGRGTSRMVQAVDRRISEARAALAKLWNAPAPRGIIWTAGGTDSLNLAIHGVLRAGDHVVTTELEHNSVLRPLHVWESDRGVSVTRVAPDEDGRVTPQAIRAALRPETRLVIVTHASNVTGVIQPIEEIGEALRSRSELLYLVDAAQTAGHVAIDLERSRIDLLCCSGHKGLLGPLGTGVVWIRSSREVDVRPFRQGGTGTHSESPVQPTESPDRYESGNLNVPGIIGLAAGVDWIAERGLATITARCHTLTQQLYAGLTGLPRVHVVTPDPSRIANAGVVSFTVDGIDPRVVANLLDAHFGIELRAGFHCAPLVHRSLGTTDQGGTLRASLGPFSTEGEIDALLTALAMVTVAM